MNIENGRQVFWAVITAHTHFVYACIVRMGHRLFICCGIPLADRLFVPNLFLYLSCVVVWRDEYVIGPTTNASNGTLLRVFVTFFRLANERTSILT